MKNIIEDEKNFEQDVKNHRRTILDAGQPTNEPSGQSIRKEEGRRCEAQKLMYCGVSYVRITIVGGDQERKRRSFLFHSYLCQNQGSKQERKEI